MVGFVFLLCSLEKKIGAGFRIRKKECCDGLVMSAMGMQRPCICQKPVCERVMGHMSGFVPEVRQGTCECCLFLPMMAMQSCSTLRLWVPQFSVLL